MPHASYDPLRLRWYLGCIQNVYCKGGAGGCWGKGIFFKEVKFFKNPPTFAFLDNPHPLLTRIKDDPPAPLLSLDEESKVWAI